MSDLAKRVAPSILPSQFCFRCRAIKATPVEVSRLRSERDCSREDFPVGSGLESCSGRHRVSGGNCHRPRQRLPCGSAADVRRGHSARRMALQGSDAAIRIWFFASSDHVCSLKTCRGVGVLPPTFIYFVALMVWMTLACVVWLLAGAMALNRGSRRTGLSLALAMTATFPSVFLFQAVAAPLIAAMIVGMAWLSGFLDPASRDRHATTNGLVIAMSIGTALLAFVTMSAVSIIGFFEGWLLGWRCARGEHVRDVVKRGPTVRLLRRLGFRKLHRTS
jgi:hypothetical protein